MATRQEIKDAILRVAGNPESGVVKQYVDAWADAIVALDEPVRPEVKKAEPEVKETRVFSAAEKR